MRRKMIDNAVYGGDGKLLYKETEEKNTAYTGDGKEILYEKKKNKFTTYGGDGHIISEE
jgi:hypothetical protein